MKTRVISSCVSGSSLLLLLGTNLLTASAAYAIPVITYDNRIISTSGFGQTQDETTQYYDSWDQSLPVASAVSITDGVEFVTGPPTAGYYSLYTHVEQNSAVTPTQFTASGQAVMGTGTNNSSGPSEMHVRSLYDVGFDLDETYQADMTAFIDWSPVMEQYLYQGTAVGQLIVSLTNITTNESVFSYSYDYTMDRLQTEIFDSALLAAGSYALLVGAFSDLSFLYADFEPPYEGYSAYDFSMTLSAVPESTVPEPSALALTALGLLAMVAGYRRNKEKTWHFSAS